MADYTPNRLPLAAVAPGTPTGGTVIPLLEWARAAGPRTGGGAVGFARPVPNDVGRGAGAPAGLVKGPLPCPVGIPGPCGGTPREPPSESSGYGVDLGVPFRTPASRSRRE